MTGGEFRAVACWWTARSPWNGRCSFAVHLFWWRSELRYFRSLPYWTTAPATAGISAGRYNILLKRACTPRKDERGRTSNKSGLHMRPYVNMGCHLIKALSRCGVSVTLVCIPTPYVQSDPRLFYLRCPVPRENFTLPCEQESPSSPPAHLDPGALRDTRLSYPLRPTLTLTRTDIPASSRVPFAQL